MTMNILRFAYTKTKKLIRFTARSNRNKILKKAAASRSLFCNLGCGARTHADWLNIDFAGNGEELFGWDLRTPLPLVDKSCDVVYSSHLIEHFSRVDARKFLAECQRLLKPGGIIRLVAPDLEGLAREYLKQLAAVRSHAAGAADQYEWIIIEMLDQMVRHQSGGEMLDFWRRNPIPAENYILQRVGQEFSNARKALANSQPPHVELSQKAVGSFRLGGEVHQWMYDSYSLGKILAESGFIKIRNCTATESRIPRFASYNLDTNPDGTMYKPDSIFLEAENC
jgi:SAM-dependent methyltransferase